MRGAPSDPTAYPPEYFALVEYFRETPSGVLTLRFDTPQLASQFRRRFYGWREALLKTAKEGEDPRVTLYPLFKLSPRLRGVELTFVNGDEDEGVHALRDALRGMTEVPEENRGPVDPEAVGMPQFEIEEKHRG